MTAYKFDRTISLGNLIQVIVLSLAAISFFFGLRASVAANTDAIKQNSAIIKEIQREIGGVDVIQNELHHLQDSLERIEKKLDE